MDDRDDTLSQEPAGSPQDGDDLAERVRRLERANEELRRTNARLAAERMPRLDSAAAGALRREQPSAPRPSERLRARTKASLRSLVLRILR